MLAYAGHAMDWNLKVGFDIGFLQNSRYQQISTPGTWC